MDDKEKIAELKKLVEEKQSTIESLMNIMDEIPGDIYWKNLDGVYQFVNFTGINNLIKFGFISGKTDIVGKKDHEIFNYETAHQFRNNDFKVINNKTPVSREECAVLPTGENITQISVKKPLFNRHGDLIGVIGNTVDISKLKETEFLLRKALSAKSEFISNMSHDIRTPITGIFNMAQNMIIASDKLKTKINKDQIPLNIEDINDFIKTIKLDSKLLCISTNELLKLCNETLEISKLEAENRRCEIEKFEPKLIIEQNIKLIQPIIKSKNLKFDCSYDNDIPVYLKGNRVNFDRILLNIVSNSLKFTKKGNVNLVLKLLKNKDYKLNEEVLLQLQVHDEGKGIPCDKFEEIFNYFSRLDPSYKGRYKGSGLGLYNVHKFVKFMKGSIFISSELGVGTSVVINLPFEVADSSDNKISPKHESTFIDFEDFSFMLKDKEQAENNKFFNNILLVEDNFIVASGLKTTFSFLECNIDVADNGYKALDYIKKNNYDLVLMDIGLPDISGLEVTKLIRQLDDTEKANIPIVGVTGHLCEDSSKQEAIKHGMQDIMQKPIKKQDLEKIYLNFIKKSNLKENL